MNEYKVTAIICAAGTGTRAGFGKNKLLAPLDGAPALWHTLKKFDMAEIDQVIVTSSDDDLAEIKNLCEPFGYTVVKGGNSRTESVKNALAHASGEIVLIHDGARPFVKRQLILNCIDSVKKFGSGVCAVKATDTLVSAVLGQIGNTIDRDSAYRVQTPQGFLTEDIKRAYELAGDGIYTDDSGVYCDFIQPARLIEGDEENIKLTYKSDFTRAMPPLPSGDRVGFGVDVHAFCAGDHITLGGVKIPFDRGFEAHSDGDVLIHAVMDALLSAAGLKDIGHYFPVNDEKYDGADSRELLKTVVSLLNSEGYVPFNVSVTVQAEKPRLSPYIDIMKSVIADICGIQTNAVAISAGTSEGLGFVGEGLGITAYCAVALRLKNG